MSTAIAQRSSSFCLPSVNLADTQVTNFPEALETHRSNAKQTDNPYIQMEYVDFLLNAADKIVQAPEAIGLYLAEEGGMIGAAARQEKLESMQTALQREAVKWLKRLANAGAVAGRGRAPLPEAQFRLAELYGRGLHRLPIDHGAAFSLYLQASKQMHAMASYRVAVCYEVGAGCKLDYTRAVLFYRKAASLGEGLAMHKLALILLYGKLGHPRNLKEGITWLKRAANHADANHPEALHDLAQCYERQGGCPVLIPDESYAFELYIRAAQLGFAPSQCRLGAIFEFGLLGQTINQEESIRWYGKAAEQGFADAELSLSNWYLEGSPGVLAPSDYDAFLWAKRAADRQHPRAYYVLGHYFERGIGVPRDMERAKCLYELAKQAGYERAAKRLAELEEAAGLRKPSRCTIQ